MVRAKRGIIPAVTGSPKRRVLVLPEWYPSSRQPVAGSFVREHARAAAQRHEVVVLYLDPDQSSREDRREGPLRLVRLPRPTVRLPGASTPLRLLALQRALRQLRRDGFSPDLLHAHVYSAGAIAVALGRLQRLPVVVSEHYSGFQLGTLSRAELRKARFAFARAEAVSTPSRTLAEAIEQLGLRGHMVTVPNVVDEQRFAPPSSRTRERPTRLLTVALLERVKGIDLLLEAFARLSPDIKLSVVGDGSERPALEELAAGLGLESRVTFLGLLDPDGVAEQMQQADLFVLPSRSESLGTVLAEAAATGLPAVASNVGGVPEVVDESSGVLVAPEDPGALAAGITQALERLDGFDRTRISQQARERFGFEAGARRWSEVYEEALRRRRGGV
jgi:L-malate glycosyltransferase